MIPAAKSDLFGRFFSLHAERRLRAAFSSVGVRGLDRLAAATGAGPVLVVSNHTAWWDPLVAIALSYRVLHVDAYALMDAKNLRRFPFFAKVGAFGVDLDDPADGARALRYAKKLLDHEQKRLLWIFPQGAERPVTERPLGFKAGSAHIARASRAVTVIPIGLRYEMRSAPQPELFVSVGEPVLTKTLAAQEEGVTQALDVIERSLVAGTTGADFAPLFAGSQRRPGVDVAARILSWLTAPRRLGER